MSSSSFHMVVTWGFCVLGFGLLLIVALMWCHDVNKKLNYILGRLNKIPSHGSEDMDLVALSGVSQSGKVIPLHVAFAIIAAAIILLFVIPLLLINR